MTRGRPPMKPTPEGRAALTHLRRSLRRLERAEREVERAVLEARHVGNTWSAIGRVFGRTHWAAMHRYRKAARS